MAKKRKKTPSRRGRNLSKPEFFIDRELSWLAFNDRVVEEAEDTTTPTLERLRFLGIAVNNLDEFFMVRVSGIQEQVRAKVKKKNQAGFSPIDQFHRVHEKAHEQVTRIYKCYRDHVLPALQEEGIYLRNIKDLTRPQRNFVRQFFDREVFPVLTPLGIDSGHPFPHLRNLSLNLAVRLDYPTRRRPDADWLFAVVQVPTVLDRLVRLPSKEGVYEFLLLEELIAEEIKLLFPGVKVREVCSFRVTRDADIEFAEEEADDLLKTIEEELRRRERGSAVRLGIEKKASPELVNELCHTLDLEDFQVYAQDGPINLNEMAKITSIVDRRDLKFPSFTPATREPLRSEEDIFTAVARQDVLLHHPFESFTPVVEFIEAAAKDPNVLAIKQTMYRTSGDSKIIKALMAAADNGKQVAALMELKARFDEENNIEWAKKMEKAGVHVVYGLVGLKTHAKTCLVVRKEPGGLRRYIHLGTGNYNPITAKVYTDIGLLTCDADLCDDATELFNLLTGYSRMPHWRKMVIAPTHMRQTFLKLIDKEIRKAKKGNKGRVRAKMNSLVDAGIITKLYEASRAGVKIELFVRGICCLRPGMDDVSKNIKVYSIVDQFLEHSRVYIFGESPDEQIFLSSADWMPRNLDRRIETLFPIESKALRDRIIEEVWEPCIKDNVKKRELQSDGNYKRRKTRGTPYRAQKELLLLEDKIKEEIHLEETRNEILVSPSNNLVTFGEDKKVPLTPAKPAARDMKVPKKSEAEDKLLEIMTLTKSDKMPDLTNNNKPKEEQSGSDQVAQEKKNKENGKQK